MKGASILNHSDSLPFLTSSSTVKTEHKPKRLGTQRDWGHERDWGQDACKGTRHLCYDCNQLNRSCDDPLQASASVSCPRIPSSNKMPSTLMPIITIGTFIAIPARGVDMSNSTASSVRDRLLLLLVLSSPLFFGLAVLYGGLFWVDYNPEPRRREKLRFRIADEYRQRGDTIVSLQYKCSQCGELQSPIGTDGDQCPFCYAIFRGEKWGPP